MRPVHRRLAGWLALAALLLAALAPTLSHALRASPDSPWLAVCTAQGPARLLALDGPGDGLPGAAHAADHCPLCSLHLPGLGLPPAAATPALADGLAHALPRAFLAAPRTLHVWSCAQARAPPAA